MYFTVKIILKACLISYFCVACSDNKNELATQENKEYLQKIKTSIDFIKNNAYSDTEGVFYSELDNEGNIISDKVYLVSLSRTIYALAYSSKFFPENLALAKKSAKFLQENFIYNDTSRTYFLTELNLTNKNTHILEKVKDIDIWQQAYGLIGLVELYNHWPDANLLITIELMHSAFIHNFMDIDNGGFFGKVDLSQGPDITSKTLQSTIYPISAYMNNLWATSPTPEKYERTLARQADFAFKYLWNTDTNWVNVKFKADWKACKNTQGECFSVTPGHNFQLAWLLMNTKNWSFLSKELRDKYIKLGKNIIAKTLEKPIWDNSIKNGFFSSYNPSNSVQLSNIKTWWQHCEAIIALSFYDRNGEKLADLLNFFESNFIDHVNGGEYFNLDNNTPITADPKSSIGKSAYHTVEMYRYLIENN
ncbi:AGE family epimerase/isomerase [Colwellia sp. E2M01]|uniref:AGE family epimerase/isomerase n=1 Tax=Colwellia sp. E2M01 TaxID=2841561 RepID=UPI001C081CC0|nr:AGE family epimerase/isomerase [Colwellia sp. E2M01]MBU2871037.1 AGE family epimerase/isomerase [Colwellia sp. E2M01]